MPVLAPPDVVPQFGGVQVTTSSTELQAHTDALLYLNQYPYECSEQVFNRLYANSLGRHIVQSDPKIRRVFEQWRNTPAPSAAR